MARFIWRILLGVLVAGSACLAGGVIEEASRRSAGDDRRSEIHQVSDGVSHNLPPFRVDESDDEAVSLGLPVPSNFLLGTFMVFTLLGGRYLFRRKPSR